MYSKPTTTRCAIALEKGVMQIASGKVTDCEILMPLSEEKGVFGVNPFDEETVENINW